MRGHVYQRGKSWTYVINLDSDPLTGERKQKSKGGFKDEGTAWSECHSVIAKINKGIYIDTSNMTMAEYLKLYLDTHAKPNFKPTSYDTEKTIIDARIIPELGKMKLQRITALAIKKYYATLSEKYSSDYVRNIHGVLNRAMRQAFTLDLVEMNVMDKIRTPKIQKQEMMFWTFEEWTKFIFAAEGHVHYIVFSLGVYTGMRRGEILGLRWKDIDFDRGILTINQTLNWTRSGIIIQPSPKTVTSNRQVKLDEYLIADLKDRKKQVDDLKIEHGTNYEDHDLVCCYGYGGPIKPKRITEAFNVLTKKAGLIKIRLHDLRHTYASFLLSIGINPKIAAERMGMSPAMFTSRYSHLLPNMQEDAVTQIEERIREGRKKLLKTVDN